MAKDLPGLASTKREGFERGAAKLHYPNLSLFLSIYLSVFLAVFLSVCPSNHYRHISQNLHISIQFLHPYIHHSPFFFSYLSPLSFVSSSPSSFLLSPRYRVEAVSLNPQIKGEFEQMMRSILPHAQTSQSLKCVTLLQRYFLFALSSVFDCEKIDNKKT